MLPALLLSVVSETVVQYALAQGQALPGMVSSLTCLLLSPGLNWGLVYGCGGVLWFMPLGVIMGESREQLLRVREWEGEGGRRGGGGHGKVMPLLLL